MSSAGYKCEESVSLCSLPSSSCIQSLFPPLLSYLHARYGSVAPLVGSLSTLGHLESLTILGRRLRVDPGAFEALQRLTCLKSLVWRSMFFGGFHGPNAPITEPADTVCGLGGLASLAALTRLATLDLELDLSEAQTVQGSLVYVPELLSSLSAMKERLTGLRSLRLALCDGFVNGEQELLDLAAFAVSPGLTCLAAVGIPLSGVSGLASALTDLRDLTMELDFSIEALAGDGGGRERMFPRLTRLRVLGEDLGPEAAAVMVRLVRSAPLLEEFDCGGFSHYEGPVFILHQALASCCPRLAVLSTQGYLWELRPLGALQMLTQLRFRRAAGVLEDSDAEDGDGEQGPFRLPPRLRRLALVFGRGTVPAAEGALLEHWLPCRSVVQLSLSMSDRPEATLFRELAVVFPGIRSLALRYPTMTDVLRRFFAFKDLKGGTQQGPFSPAQNPLRALSEFAALQQLKVQANDLMSADTNVSGFFQPLVGHPSLRLLLLQDTSPALERKGPGQATSAAFRISELATGYKQT